MLQKVLVGSNNMIYTSRSYAFANYGIPSTTSTS